MRKSVVLATIAIAGAGAAGLGAISLNGSDTLGDLTHDLVGPVVHTGTFASPVCAANGFSNASSITYLGGGSGLGETNLSKGTQHIAPMSRMLKKGSGTNPCAPATGAGLPSTANGIVIALDGVTNIVSQNSGGSVACNGPAADTDCAPNAAENAVGLAYNTTVPAALRTPFNATAGAYTFGSWQDVLKILYFGVVDTNFNHGSDVDVGKNCNSSIRNAIANNWGQIFQNNCSAGNCTQLQHLFRRDDGSGTSDIFSSLLGQTGPNVTQNAIPAVAGNWALGNDAFCNDLQGNGGAEWPGSNPAKSTDNGIVPNDDQDYDPIRRGCNGFGTNKTVGNATEQTCERGTYNAATHTWSAPSLGLLLPLADDTAAPSVVSNLGGPAVQTQFDLVTDTAGTHVNRCTGGVVAVTPPQVSKLTGAAGATNGYCPNGDLGSNGFCLVPADNNGNPNCISFSADTPPLNGVCTTQGTNANNYGNTGTGPVCDSTAGSLNPQLADPRAFNLFGYNFVGGAWVFTSDNAGRPTWGAYKRIHTSQAMYNSPSNAISIDSSAPGGATPSPMCTKNDATDQIGCLVQASPCSMGYAGRTAEGSTGPNPSGSALAMSPNTTGLKILGVPDNSACIQAFTYRLSRKLYLNTIIGFDVTQTASAPEWDLARCESNASLINQVALTNNFVALPDAGGPTIVGGPNNGLAWGTVVAGKPFCEDFNEGMICNGDAGANFNACANNDNTDGGIPGVAQGNSAVCGNGIVEQFEDCDNGTGNGASPAACSTICRFNIL
jgi:hypothetical protein